MVEEALASKSEDWGSDPLNPYTWQTETGLRANWLTRLPASVMPGLTERLCLSGGEQLRNTPNISIST